MIRVISFDSPEWNISEILRYARADKNDKAVLDLINECRAEAESVLSYKVCFSVSDIIRTADSLSFAGLSVQSHTLDKALDGCKIAVVFAATIGTPFDRLIMKYSRISPSKALILQAIGAERVESLCDKFCSYLSEELDCKLRTRVSPGYGDIDLSIQRNIFALLDCPKKIGLTLNEALLMSPSKSVTAIAGITDSQIEKIENSCLSCKKADCAYRK